MKEVKILFVACLILGSSYSCTDDVRVYSYSDSITGKWQLVGTQISPGSPVPVSSVPAFPLQILEFKNDSTVASSVTGMTPVSSYSIHDDTLFHLKGLFLYADPNRSNASAKGSYRFSLRHDTLRIGNMGCDEVCDQIFKRLH